MVVQDKPNFRDVSQGETGSSDRKQRLRERFEVVKKLGQGTYGKVQLAVNKETKQEVAIKTIKKAKIENEQDLVRIRREIQIMSSIHHPHIIHIYEVFENQEKIVLIMQYASGGELYDYLGCRKKLDENEARRVFRQVASAIFYCHKNHICHRDLKLENILLDDRGNAKIADFGLSNVFDERCKLKTFCGSPLYASPEIVKGTPYSGPEVDCWSLGVLLYTLVYGAMPFDGSNFKRLVKQISEGEYFEPKEKSGASGLIRRLLTVDTNHRATIRDICSDWWVNQGYDHSLLKIAGDMANLTPVRFDLLLALSSSSSTQAADQSVKKQQIAPTIRPAESRNVLSNGYYSKSHPLCAPENGASRKRIVTAAGECNLHNAYVNKNTGQQQTFGVVDSTKNLMDKPTRNTTKQEHVPLPDAKKMLALKTPAADKNENNTLIIVQDLIKDVISRVEQHINSSKMELLRTTAPKQTQENISGGCGLSQVTACQENGIKDDIMEYEDTPDTLRTAEETESLHTSPDGHSFLRKNGITAAAKQDSQPCCSPSTKSAIGLTTVTEGPKMAGVSNGTIEADMEYLPEKADRVQRGIFGERRKSIPNKNGVLQSRKDVVKLEPDVVIPIFNVCSNIPKRSSDPIKPPPNDSKLNDVFRSMTNRLSEKDSKAVDGDVKSNDEQLPKGDDSKDIVSSSSKANADTVSKNHCQDFRSPETESQVSNCSNETFQRRTSTLESISGSAVTDTKESLPQTEVPKLPPRRRFLIKIPKQGQSNEKDATTAQSGSGDSHKIHVCDKQENKVFAEKSGMYGGVEEQELQTADKNLSVSPVLGDKEKVPTLCSEDDASLTPNKAGEDTESSPKLSQRKSRRDSSKRSLSCNTKTGMNRDSGHTMSEKPNCRKNERDCLETSANISATELNDPDTPRVKPAETLEDAVLPQDQIDRSSNSILKHTIYSSSDNAEQESLNLAEYSEILNLAEHSEMSTSVKWVETLERELKNTILLTGNDDLQETGEGISSRCEADEEQNMERSSFYDAKYSSTTAQQEVDAEPKQSKPLVKSKQRSLSRTRAMSMEFESLAQMTAKIVCPPKKPPGKVEIPKSFDPTQTVTSPKAEMKEIIFIPTACVSENKEKIQKKIEKVKKSVIVIPPRRKSDAGVTSRKKKYTRSKTDFILRNDDVAVSAEDENLTMDEMQRDSIYREAILQNEETSSPENMDGETASSEMWYSAVSPDNESEECEQRFKDECAGNFDGFCNENDATDEQNNQQHRHSVDTESGYWTPPEMARGTRSVSQASIKMKDDKIAKKYDNSEKIMLQRAAFKNSKLRMKLSDEGLDMCSLSSSLESGIYSWRQEEINGKRISPDSESAVKVFPPLKFAEMASDGSYAPIARSFKKMTFPPQHSSTSELSENCSMAGDAEKNACVDVGGKDNGVPQGVKPNGVNSRPIKPSDSQSSYGSNDISDDVFESWVDKEDVALASKYGQSEDNANSSSTLNVNKNRRDRKARNWQRGETWHSFSTDKESSDNDDDLDLMVDESHQLVYGTEGLWQFLKSVNQHLSSQLQSATQKMSSKPICHRSKSQESKHPDDVLSEKRPVTRSLSREEKERKGCAQLRHFVSEGKLTNTDSIDCFEGTYTRFNDTRYSSGYMASGSSLEDSGMTQKDFMGSVDSFHNHSDDISIYGTLRRDKYFHSSSALSSPSVTRRKKSLQNVHSSGDLYDNADSVVDDELTKYSTTSEQNRKLSLYGTLRPKHLSQQGRAQSQILLSTDDGYQLLYNERLKKDPCSETRYGSLGTLGSSAHKASSEVNVSMKGSQIKDYEKILLTDLDEDDLKRPLISSASHRNTSNADSSYHTVNDKPTPRAKKIATDKGIRRVSFSNDVKASKSDYHSSLRLNSLNKVREANEELLNSSNHKSNTYEDEQDSSGSLLEALKTYGYRGIMSQKLQSSPDKYEPRLNYRLPTECFLSTGLNKPGWDDFEFVPVENTLAYQQPIYSPVDTMEYYHCKTFTKGSQKKRNIGEYTDIAYDDDSMFKDIFRSHRLGESDVVSRRKPVHKFQDLNDLHLSHSDRHARENRDAKHANSTRKKCLESTAVVLNSERRNSGSEKIIQHGRDRDSEETGSTGSTDLPESRVSKQTENSIEILSGKIQALKSRCQRKSVDEGRPKKELEDAGVLSSENKDCEKTVGLDPESEKVRCHADHEEAHATQESESSESVSDRIWRKSFYSRFNDVSTVRRKKSSLLDSDCMSGHSFLRSAGKFNIDEEGGVEEPWLNTSMKRRNSNFSRSLPRQSTVRASSLNSDGKAEHAGYSSGYHKRGASEADKENKRCTATERRSPSQSNSDEQRASIVCGNLLNPTKNEEENTNMSKNNPNTPQNTYTLDCSALKLQGSTESRIAATERTSGSGTTKNNSTDVSPIRNTCERTKDPGNRSQLNTNLPKGADNIPETQRDVTSGGSAVNSDISAPELKNEMSSPQDLALSPTAELSSVTEENLEKQRLEGNPTEPASVQVIGVQKQCDRPEANNKE